MKPGGRSPSLPRFPRIMSASRNPVVMYRLGNTQTHMPSPPESRPRRIPIIRIPAVTRAVSTPIPMRASVRINRRPVAAGVMAQIPRVAPHPLGAAVAATAIQRVLQRSGIRQANITRPYEKIPRAVHLVVVVVVVVFVISIQRRATVALAPLISARSIPPEHRESPNIAARQAHTLYVCLRGFQELNHRHALAQLREEHRPNRGGGAIGSIYTLRCRLG